MELPILNREKRRRKNTIIALLGIALVAYALWETSGFVLAFRQIKHAHVAPTNVSAVGWDNSDNALTRDLSPQAAFASFSVSNSANVFIDASPTKGGGSGGGSNIDTGTPASTSTSPDTTDTSSSAASTTPVTTPETFVPPAATQTETSTSTTTETPPVVFPTVTPLAPDTAPATEDTSPATPTTPAAPTTAPTDTVSAPSSMRSASPTIAENLKTYASYLLAQMVTVAFATTTDNPDTASSTTPIDQAIAAPVAPEENVATCTVLGTACHTMEFGGFKVGGSMTDKEFQKAELNFSFANLPGSATNGGKLTVRYYHNGHWKSAGELDLSQGLSNETNGNYFTQTLDDITAWSDMSDVKVVFEYEAGDGSAPVQLYLDAVWIDAVFVDQVQDVLAGNINDPTDAPANVTFDVTPPNQSPGMLVYDNGNTLSFPYLDALDDTLGMRLDQTSYQAAGSSSVVYTSITNTTKKTDSFKLYTSLPGGKGEVSDISQYLRNVPVANATPQVSDVTYFCQGGWQNASTTGQSYCPATGETYACKSLNVAGDNCIVGGVTVGVATSTSYISDWVSVDLTNSPGSDAQVEKNMPPGYVVSTATAKSFDILPGQTLYFKVTLSTPDSDSRRFVLSARGQSLFGDVDSLHLRTETAFAAQTKVAKKPVRPSDNINDQLSDQSDFSVDQSPSFHFKFKTQRSFFTRLKDFLFGKQVGYKVTSAQLRHASGEVEHLPVTIDYGQNDDWTLKLEKQPRAFRPGKYSIDVSMDEGGSIYTDTIPFYWGVLAMNADQSSYSPGDTAHLSIAALNDDGNTMCDAQLALTITDPSGNASDVPVVSGGGCGQNNVTTLPDFVADYAVGAPGTYTAVLSRLDDSGNIVTSTTESFDSTVSAPFVVTRDGPTRIFPASAYKMHITVTGSQGFNGQVVETLPEGFTVSDTNGGTVTRADGVMYLSWNTSITGTGPQSFSYTLKAPEVSPYIYLLGPLQLKDSTGVVFKEPNAWKIASDAVSIATGVAWLAGNQTASSTNLNSVAAFPLNWNLSADYDTAFFSYSSSSPSQLLVNKAGDYLVAVTVPIARSDTSGSRTTIEADVRVDGGKRNIGVSRAFIRTSSGAARSSDHVYVLLKGLSAGDYIESYVHNITTATDVVTVDGQASMYAEYIGNDQDVYFGLGTTTESGTNLNSAATSNMSWYDDPTFGRSDSNYTHNNTSASSTVSLASAGDYMVFINIPTSGAVTNGDVRGVVLLDGTEVTGGEFKQGYIDNTSGATDSSLQWSGVVHATTTNQNLLVTVQQAAKSGTITVNNDTASMYIQKLPTSGVYFGNGTLTSAGSTNWDLSTATTTLWSSDTINDSSVYAHSTTTNSYQITAGPTGDYLLALNDSRNGTARSSNEITKILVNGTAVTGAVTQTHFIRNAGGSGNVESSGSLVYLLRDLSASSTITVTTVAEPGTTAGTINEDVPALLMLWHKSAQSSFIQDSEWWYASQNAEPPTDPWPPGAVNLAEGDAITTGNAVKSGDDLRLRMALKANVNTVAGADSFKLQYAPGTDCSLALAWTDLGATGSGSIWRGFHNASLTAGATLSSTILSVSSTTGTYEESNPSAATPNSVTIGTDAEWDWSIEDNGAPVGTNYCFRMVQSDGQVLKDYNNYPQLVTDNTPNAPTLVSLFDNEKTASTTPAFDFFSSDDNGDDLHYQVQISTDPNFGSFVFTPDDTISNYTKFTDLNNPTGKAPFASNDKIEYVPTTALTNGTTYWWRVRAKDPSGTNTYGAFSATQSFTIGTSVTVSTWYQTTQTQFNNDTLFQVAATGTEASTDNVFLTGANTTGTIYSPAIDYALHTTGNSWGAVSWHNTQSAGNTITYHVEYLTSTSSWAIVPNAVLAGNEAGTTVSPISISLLDPTQYEFIRVRADFVKTTTSPLLSDWTVSWALSVIPPTLSAPFDNEKVPTTTPTFAFTTTDPQGDNLTYQVQWSTDANFVTGVSSSTSGISAGFTDVSSTTDSSPFASGDTINYKIQSALASSTTYWWRVRATDGNAYSIWSNPQSFTTDTTVAQSTWFQTTDDQFNEDSFVLTGALGGDVTATSTTGEIAVYRAATAGETITTATFNNGWDTTVRQDKVFSLSGTTSIQLLKGYYAVLYGLRFNSTGGNNRSEIQSNLNLAGTSLPIGWSQAFIRRNTPVLAGLSDGGGIIKVANDNDTLMLQSFRTDTNSAGVARAANFAGIELLKLDDSWPYVRLSRTSKQTGPVSSAWLQVGYDREDEINTNAYGHSIGGSGVTLKDAGHYLVFANTYGSLTTSNPSNVDQKLTLDGVDIPGSFSTVFMNGNSNSDGDYQGAATLGMIVQATTTNQILKVQIARGLGTAAWTIDGNNTGQYVNRTALTIVKLPEADFIQLQNSTSTNINPTALTPLTWNTEAEKDASFTHSVTVNTSRVTVSTPGDYLFFTANYATGTPTIANAYWEQGWLKNSTLQSYGFTGNYNSTNVVASHTGAFSGFIAPSLVNTDFIEAAVQAIGATGNIFETKKAIEGVRIASLSEADTSPKTLQSPDIVFSSGNGPKWSSVSWSDNRPASTTVLYQVLYFNSASSTYDLVPDSLIPDNSVGTSTSPIDISNLSHTTYNILRTQATFSCASGNCSSLHDWTVKWSQGVNVSGTAKAFDQTTNVTSGTVDVAVNGVLQSGKTGTISGGTWTIPNVTAFTGDVVTVFVATSSASAKAVAVTKYTSSGDITGMNLYQNHLTLGSDDNPTLTNADLNQFDDTNAAAAGLTGEVFDDVTGGNLTVCNFTSCTTARLLIKSGTVFEPSAAGSGNVTTPNFQNEGTFIPDSNTVTVSHSWKNDSVFFKGTSSVIFTATSSAETIDSTLATTSAVFNTVTFGQTSGSATWTLLSPLNASSTLAINFGTLSNGTNTLTLDGNLTIGTSGIYAHGTGSTTFSGSGTSAWTDSSAAKQDMGTVIVGGTGKTMQLGTAVKATNVTINSGSTLDVTAGNFGMTLNGNWTNNGTFSAHSGTVTFAATTTGFTIAPGSSNFYNLTFNGVGGNWAFSTSNITLGNNFTITNGTVTLPTGTTTIAGSFDASGGAFSHNNGAVLFNGSGSNTVRPGTSATNFFFDLVFNGSGSWSFPDANATTSRNVTISAGTVTLPSGTFAIGGAFSNASTFTNNSGTLKFTASSAQNITFNGSSANNLLFAGSNTLTFTDTNVTANNTVTFQSGTTTLPSGTFTSGASFIATGGAFTANGGTVKFTSSVTSKLVTPGNSPFFNLTFDNPSGGWTITGNATSTGTTTLNNAAAFALTANTALAVGGVFVNNVGGAATTFASSTLFLNSGTSYTINTKTTGGDVYGTLSVGAGTNIRMWGSNAATTTVNTTGSLYSMNHASSTGALNIYGAYTRSSGSDYWDYATDFDGTNISGTPRQVSVKIASSSTLTFSGGLLDIVGAASATTTVQNQGAGAYAWSVTGGTLNAQYYQIGSTTAPGLMLSGSPVVQSLANGSFILSISGGASLSASSTVIDRNQLMQIQQVKFATSTGVATGFNVIEKGTPTSTANFWWFRNHYGSLAGEAFDNDPGPNSGNPGYIRWDDSGYSITVAGHVYADHGSTPIGNPPCDGTTAVVTVLVGTSTYSGSCASGSGAYSIAGVQFTGDTVLTSYLNTNGGKKAVTVTKTPTTDIADMDLYQNSLVVRHEGVNPITITDLAAFDSTKDSDIFYAAATSTNTLTVQPGNELYVWGGKTFVPGGNITLQSGGNGDARDGRLFIATSSTFTAAGTQSHSIGGGLVVESGATFTAANSTFTFTATTTGKSIYSAGPLSLYNVTLNGSGGQWSLDSAAGSAALTVQNALTLTAGTLVGTGDITVQAGDVTGGGTIAMTGGTFTITSSGNFGNSNPWQFKNLTFGSGALANTSTKTGSATTTVTGVLTVASSQTLNAGSSAWVLSGSGTPFVINSTFNPQTAPFTYSATGATNITNADYASLTLAPSGAGSPTYTLGGGTPTIGSLTIGNSANPVTVTADTNDPSIAITGDVRINTNGTYVASNIGALFVGGSWINNGTFTHSNAAVTFNASTTGKSITSGNSPFYDLTVNGVGGGWTVTNNATSSHDFTLTNATNFTVSPNTTFVVNGTFTNLVGGTATTFASSTLFLNSGTSYTINTGSAGGDVYGTLSIGAGTNIRMWGSSAATTTVNPTGSLYSMNHAGVSGALNIYGAYTRSSGSDYWDYATDFDGTNISGTPRQVTVSIASSSVLTFNGGLLDMIGDPSASTTIQNQGSGAYAFNFSNSIASSTLYAQYFVVRNTDSNGLNLSGTPTITSLNNGDFQLSANGGSMITVTGAVIDTNALKTFKQDRFATPTGITSGFNVTEVGTPSNSWKFDLAYGNFGLTTGGAPGGEAYDNDPGGDPGFIRWSDSAGQITISGHVYSDEGATPSGASVCNGATTDIKLNVEGTGHVYTTSCASGTGAFSISNISFNSGDTLTLYIDGIAGHKAANISVSPVSNISGMDLYENRVIVRHEDTTPITISDMAQFDSNNDTDIPFRAVATTTPNTLTLPSNTKLIVWDNKTFAPAGNVTIQSGATSTWDGSLEVRSGGSLSAASTQTYTVGGNFTLDSDATFNAANSTVIFNATSTGKTITSPASSFYNITFNGLGGNWAFASSTATSTNDFTITQGNVTLPTGSLVVGGSFLNTGGSFAHNNGTLLLNSTATGKSVRVGTSTLFNLTADSSGGSWSFFDANATTSGSFTIGSSSTVTLPPSTLAVGSSFINTGGTFTHNSGTVKFTAFTAGQSVQAGGSDFNTLLFNGVGGGWTFLDTDATSSDFTIVNGSTTLPTGVMAIKGSFVNSGAFTSNFGTVKFIATATGKSVTPGQSNFYNLLFDSSSGGWTVTQSATSTNDTTLSNATSFTVASSSTFVVDGTFTNAVGGTATTFASSTLFLNSGTSYTINTKTTGGDVYGTLSVGASTNIRMWGSSAATTTVNATGSLYSMNHASLGGTPSPGALNIYGAYTRSSGSDYWDYATDFDGTALGGSSRQVAVNVASSSTLTFSGGLLDIVGIASATTTVQNQGAGAYSWSVSGGTLNAQYFAVQNMDGNGLNFTGTPAITSLSAGDFQLSQTGGALISVDGGVVDANASAHYTNDRFALAGGVTSGTNVLLTSSTSNAWTFSQTYGNLAGEAFDSDGATACGQIRWDDSSCLFVNQAHYRWRNDDGGEGALSGEWYNASWTARKKVAVSNPNASTLTSYPVKLTVAYDSAMNSDFSDLRFTDSSGTTSLPYFVESKTASVSAVVWVNVPSLPASGSATLYMYYGNAGATDASNGSNTFSFYDSFESNNLTAYTGTDKTLFTTGTSFAHTGTYGLYPSTGNTGAETTNGGIYRTGSLTGQGKTMRYFQYVDATAGSGLGADEPCTLFAVQAAKQNYGVCLEEFNPAGGPYVAIAKNVQSNDLHNTATILATSSITYATGWYEVSVDWLTSNTINVSVYDSSGTLQASVSTTDSTYTSGGMGFSFWEQHGGWDYYAVRPYAASAPTAIFGTAQGDSGATWAAAEDAPLTAFSGTNLRLRFSIANTGTAVTFPSDQIQLEYASKTGYLNCESVPSSHYNPVPVAGSCGTDAACMASSAQFTNLASTSPSLTYAPSLGFSPGEMVQDSASKTNGTPIAASTASEVEYNFQITGNATDSSYCFRSSENGTAYQSYDHVAQITVQHPPFFPNPPTLNGLSAILLTEGTTTLVQATSTVTDDNGFADMIQATSTFYRSGVGPLCTASDSSCYQVASSSCTFTNCSGTSCLLTCSANMQYFADPTDVGAFAGEHWYAHMSVVDSTNLYAIATSSAADVDTLFGLSLTTGSIDFGSLVNGQNTGTTNATTTVVNTGNSVINIQLYGSDLSAGASTIGVGEQKFATTTFAYGSCALCQVLTGASSPTSVVIDIPKPTSTSTPSQGNVYWGINIPSGTAATSYTGSNTFVATSP